ncbi:unnamed protein product [Linum tenue]|uniref:F-box domain-containing protein n=1 Tax=Linum tenue TaxID=586396 RepID=A0AAV0QMM9_9ROSI|nr:unnamed protein product [Linum tenue]
MALLRGKRFRSCSEENPSMVSTLGDDLLGEILIRLPDTKSAFRCKPVCKRWRSLISSPSFSRRFVSHHQSTGEARTSASSYGRRQRPAIDKNCSELGRTYVLCNPFTKQWMALPLAPEKAVGYEAPVTRHDDLYKQHLPIRSEADPPLSLMNKLGDDLLIRILIRLLNLINACRCRPVFSQPFVSHPPEQ